MNANDAALGEPFEAHVEHRGDATVLRMTGVLGSESEGRFVHRLNQLDFERGRRVVADLEGLTFIDSAGLRLILEARARCEREGLGFAIVPGKGQVRRAFELAGLDQQLDAVDGVI
jgi:anti-anti-sigma factor